MREGSRFEGLGFEGSAFGRYHGPPPLHPPASSLPSSAMLAGVVAFLRCVSLGAVYVKARCIRTHGCADWRKTGSVCFSLERLGGMGSQESTFTNFQMRAWVPKSFRQVSNDVHEVSGVRLSMRKVREGKP